ncbi:MAG: PaaI family thioesterase [Desulfovibrionaceae bacterium]|nr:PaaI family thioesterase [Desulfovibrionaceae bacterium]
MDYLKEVCKEDQTVNNLFNTLGVKVVSVSSEECMLRLPVTPAVLQGAKKVAGGVMAALADEAMAHCVIANLKAGEVTATIEMNIRYLRGIAEGELFAAGRIIRRGRTIITTEAEIKNGEGVLLATAGASFWVGQA